MGTQQQDSHDTVFTAWNVAVVGGERSFLIAAQSWSVCEVIDPTTLTPVLIFAGTGVARRVRNYPADWRELSNEALYALSWGR
jgi:hypothetical protein